MYSYQKIIGILILCVLLTPFNHALAHQVCYKKYTEPCHTHYIPIHAKTASTLMQKLQEELNKHSEKCNYMLYDERTSTIIFQTLPQHSKYILEFIQKTDSELKITQHLDINDSKTKINTNENSNNIVNPIQK